MKEPTDTKGHYSLVNASVTFDSGNGIESKDVQFMSLSSENTFPVHRLNQLQNRAAMAVQQHLVDSAPKGQQSPKFDVHDVTFKSIIYLGHMTAIEFHGAEPVQLEV